MSLQCFHCHRNINFDELFEFRYIYPNLKGDIFLIRICNLCSSSSKCIYKDKENDNDMYLKLKIKNNMEKVKIHNSLGEISGINIFKDFDKMAKWISERKLGDEGYKWLLDNNYLGY